VLGPELGERDVAEMRQHVVTHAPLVGGRRRRSPRRRRLHQPVLEELPNGRTPTTIPFARAVFGLDEEPALRRDRIPL
jgi:hypothetical protein